MLSVSLPAGATVTWSPVRTNGCSAVTLTGRSDGRPVFALVLRPTSSIQMSVVEFQFVTQLWTFTVLTDQKFVYHDVSSPRSPSSVSVSVGAFTWTMKSMYCQPEVAADTFPFGWTTPFTDTANDSLEVADP